MLPPGKEGKIMYSNTKLLEAAKKYGTSVLIEMLTENIREESAKATGTKKPLSVIKTLINNAPDSRFNKAHIIGNRIFFLDPHRIFESKTSFGYEEIKPCEVIKACPGIVDTTEKDATEKVQLDTAEINAFIKLTGATRKNAKGRNKPYFCMTDSGVVMALNPFYLLDMIAFTGSTTLYCEKYNHPVFMKGETNKAVLLPIVSREITTPDLYNQWKAHTFGREIKTA